MESDAQEMRAILLSQKMHSNDVFAERLCQYGEGVDPNRRDPDACPKVATNITEEGIAYCLEHAESFYSCVAILEGRPTPKSPTV